MSHNKKRASEYRRPLNLHQLTNRLTDLFLELTWMKIGNSFPDKANLLERDGRKAAGLYSSKRQEDGRAAEGY